MLVEFIAHRINTIEELGNAPLNFGVEIDLRESQNGVILQHDPFKPGVLFEDYIQHYQHGTLILNIKSEGIEACVLSLLRQQNIKAYFFLDCSFPKTIELSLKGEKNLSLRYSEYEGLDSLIQCQSFAKWAWVDTFSSLPLDAKVLQQLKRLNYKVCLVSPELQGQDEKLEVYGQQLLAQGIVPDAICSKTYNYKRWCQFYDFK